MLLIFWVIGHLLHRNVLRPADFFKHQFLSMLRADQGSEQLEEIACTVVAVAEIDQFGTPSSRGYLLPTDEIIVDDDLPILVKLPEHLHEEWGGQSLFRTWE